MGLIKPKIHAHLTPETTFIHDPLPTYDFCTNPSLLTLHGSLSFDFPRDNALRPIFQWSKNSRNPEFLATPLEAYENATSGSALAKYTPWEEKSINKVFWRGSSTGDSYSRRKGYDWRRSHRPRLHLLAQASRGQKGVWVQRDTGNGRGTGKGNEWVWEMWGNKELNERYLDVGLTGGPHQVGVRFSFKLVSRGGGNYTFFQPFYRVTRKVQSSWWGGRLTWIVSY